MKSKRNKTEPQLDEIDNEVGECNETGENSELQSPQAQTRWTPECTRVMLQLRFERQIEFQQRIRQKKELWSEIATEMRRQGLCDFSLTAEVCDLKYRNMLQTYKKNRLKEDSGMHSLIAWEYYDLFKEGLTLSDDLDVQEGQRRVVPLLLCESVCDVSNEDVWSASNELDSKISIMEAEANVQKDTSEIIDDDTEYTSNITLANNRKGKKRSIMKIEENILPTADQQHCMKTEIATPSRNSRAENIAIVGSSELTPQQAIIKPDTSVRPQRKHTFPSLLSSISKAKIEHDSVEADVSTMNVVQNDPIISSTSTSTIPMPTIIHAPPLQPPLSQSALSSTPPNQTGITIVHSNQTQAVPVGLVPSEMRECQVFGESIGLQLAHVSDPHIRAMAQLKIQELLYLAKTGKLLEPARV
ncbi:uncharacterized protein LOC101449962 isoform X2 [Ceratitis capitata]|uniref:(Mediterranean fruit fly) hypothetical protein n=1 Tax=Ceratitis capitata TaxID=7213 RepID=W8BYG2_CERCA|nr:uncharacterized protein LOC101449962 isoform X2 [Ceratitis capitata]CAD7014780.1 unnamed protein product [Ceratitis capitata]